MSGTKGQDAAVRVVGRLSEVVMDEVSWMRRAFAGVVGVGGFVVAAIAVYAGGVWAGLQLPETSALRDAWAVAMTVVAVLCGLGVGYGLRRVVRGRR